MQFQSTHPVWGGTDAIEERLRALAISIHPPRVGWDLLWCLKNAIVHISIHPPRVGWDGLSPPSKTKTPISIHPPRVGWDCAVP